MRKKRLSAIILAVLLSIGICTTVTQLSTRVVVAQSATPTSTPATPDGGGEGDKVSYDPCDRLGQDAAKEKCTKCMGTSSSSSGNDNPKGFWTAIGCIPTNPVSATRDLLTFMLGVGGFFVVVQILIGSFQLLTSRGNPQALQAARERITNSVIALLFIVFSVTILEFVGVTILHIPGFFSSGD